MELEGPAGSAGLWHSPPSHQCMHTQQPPLQVFTPEGSACLLCANKSDLPCVEALTRFDSLRVLMHVCVRVGRAGVQGNTSRTPRK